MKPASKPVASPSRRLVNADKPHLWKADVHASVDQFNAWFMAFAPDTFRTTRRKTTEQVKAALMATGDLLHINPPTLRDQPEALPTLRMCTAPPLAVDRLIGLARLERNLVMRMEAGRLPTRMAEPGLSEQLARLCNTLALMLDRDLFPWLAMGVAASEEQRERAATVVADRLCSAVSNPIIRNAQEQRQLKLLGDWLQARGYVRKAHPPATPLSEMEPGTFAFRMNIRVGETLKVNVPVDVLVQPHKRSEQRLPILIEAKSAGDFTNTNKRRKEEAIKVHQLRAAYGASVQFVLFLCGYFGPDYLGYEAAEGIDWVWEHRIDDLAQLGLMP